MIIADRKNITREKTASWESELWSYLSIGDGITCPARNACRGIRPYGECPDMHRKQMRLLLDEGEVDLNHFDFITNSNKYFVNCRLFQLIERLAWKYIKRGKIYSPPVPEFIIHLFDTGHPIIIREVPIKYLRSAIWYEDDRWIIQLKSSDPPPIKRYSLFHEGFHILAHCNTNPIFKKIGFEDGSFNELLAGYFAGCILVPAKWLIEKWAQVNNLDKMAELFDINVSSIYIRLRQFGLL